MACPWLCSVPSCRAQFCTSRHQSFMGAVFDQRVWVTRCKPQLSCKPCTFWQWTPVMTPYRIYLQLPGFASLCSILHSFRYISLTCESNGEVAMTTVLFGDSTRQRSLCHMWSQPAAVAATTAAASGINRSASTARRNAGTRQAEPTQHTQIEVSGHKTPPPKEGAHHQSFLLLVAGLMHMVAR